MVVPWLHGHLIGTVSPDGAIEIGGVPSGFGFGVTLGSGYVDGAVELGGSGPSVKWTLAADGGMQLRGSGAFVTFGWSSDGAIEYAGSGANVTINRAVGGGIEIGGVPSGFGFTITLAAPGGASEIGGDGVGVPLRTAGYSPDGAMELRGSGANVAFSKTLAPDGAIQIGGDAVTAVWGANFIGSGGAIIGGGTVATVTKYSTGDPTPITYTLGTTHRGPTTQIAILNAIRDHLIDQGLFTTSTCWIGVDPIGTDNAPNGDQFLIISPGSKVVDQPAAAGSGVEVDMQIETIELQVFHRLALDQLNRRTLWASSRAYGAYLYARNVANAVHVCDLMDRSGTTISAEPIRVLQISPPRMANMLSGWGNVTISLEVRYRTNFDSTL